MNKSCLKMYFQILMNCIKVIKGETWLADMFPNMNILACTPGKNYGECFCKFRAWWIFLKYNLGPKGPNFPVNWNTNEICHSVIEVHDDIWRTVCIHQSCVVMWKLVGHGAHTVLIPSEKITSVRIHFVLLTNFCQRTHTHTPHTPLEPCSS